MSRGRFRRGARRCALVAALAIACGACQTEWTTWGNGPERRGENALEWQITRSNVAQLRHLWSVPLGAGVVNTQPIVVRGVNVRGTPTDVVFVGTEHGVLFAITTSGQVLWYRGLGSSDHPWCSFTPDHIYGISASPVYDHARGRLYVANGVGEVFSLDPATGATEPGWPVALTSDGLHEVVTSSPTLHDGHLYFELASHCDEEPYHGRIIDIDPATHTIAHTWYVTGGPDGPDGGGIWGWGGVSVDPADGDVYVATGNALTTPENLPYADSIVRLTSDLVVKAYHTPTVAIVDDDFGSTPTLFQKPGCPPQLVAEQKNGSLYLYDRDSIASGFRQRVTFSRVALIGVAAYSSRTQLLYVVNPHGTADGTFTEGLAAFRIDENCRLSLAWQTSAPVSVGSTPIVAGDVVYYTGGFAGQVRALDAYTGAPLWDSGSAITGSILAAPTVVNGQLYAAGYDSRLHAFGR